MKETRAVKASAKTNSSKFKRNRSSTVNARSATRPTNSMKSSCATGARSTYASYVAAMACKTINASTACLATALRAGSITALIARQGKGQGWRVAARIRARTTQHDQCLLKAEAAAAK